MPAEAEPIHACFCWCGGTECDRFGGVFRCLVCRERVDPFDVSRPPDQGWEAVRVAE